MNKKTNEELETLVSQATAGDQKALELLITEMQDLVFNLSLRMLGTFQDAEDATQEILLKMMTHLSSFRKESAVTTWVFSIAVNHLKNYKKHMFAHAPLSFDFYAADITNSSIEDVPDLTQDVEKSVLAEELKLSCTNVLLQCLDAESRCIFILGTMFHIDSRIAGNLFGMTPEAYRQRLSRIRKKMADFLSAYCGEYGSGNCRCKDRVNYAIKSRRIHPARLDYTSAAEADPRTLTAVKAAMEEIDGLSQSFTFCKAYQTPERIRQSLKRFLNSAPAATVINS